MAIYDFNNPMGLLGVNNNPTGSLGLNISPTLDARAKQAEEDEAKRKRAEQSLKLQNLADTFRMVNANKSGNTQGVALYSNRLANRRAEEQARLKAEQAKRDQEKLLASLPPETQRIFEIFGAKAAYDNLYSGSKNPNTESERSRIRLMELNNKTNLNAQEQYEMNLLKTNVYGAKEVIPFFDSNANPLPKIITNWDLNDNPELLEKLTKEGFATVGSNPSGAFSAPTSANEEIAVKWEDTKNTLNLINDLATVLDQGRDSPTLAGAIADLVNTGIYQVKSANKLINYEKNHPDEYMKTVNYINNKHKGVLDKISSDRGIATSTVMRLAYSLAKQQDPGGRLSDKDVDAAIEMIGGSGANVDKRLSVLGSLHKSLSGQHNTYLERQQLMYPGNKSIQSSVNNFKTLPAFRYSAPQQNSKSVDDILNELGIQ
jgi:hypothetical protein